MRQTRGEICQAAGRPKSAGVSTVMLKKSNFASSEIFVPDTFHIRKNASIGDFELSDV